MALINCPDCSKEISDTASTCIGCGRPMRDGTPSFSPVAGNATQPIVIEQTSKKWKAGLLWGIVLLVFGFFSVTIFGAFSLVICVVAILLILGSLLGAWWNHS